jgi:hypothetical protein
MIEDLRLVGEEKLAFSISAMAGVGNGVRA